MVWSTEPSQLPVSRLTVPKGGGLVLAAASLSHHVARASCLPSQSPNHLGFGRPETGHLGETEDVQHHQGARASLHLLMRRGGLRGL